MSKRQLALILATLFCLLSPAVQAGLGIGLSAAAFSHQGDQTLRAAGYGFAIWAVIYLGLAAFAVFQGRRARRDDPLLGALAAPAALAIVGAGAWIWASAFNARWLSVAIIVGSAAVLTLGLARQTRRVEPLDRSAAVLAWTPLCLLAGWLTIASTLNILTVLTAEALIAPGSARAAFAGLGASALIALSVLLHRRMWPYGLPIVWGLVAVWVAEQTVKPAVAALALACAAVIGLVVVTQAWRSLSGRIARAV
ncbi:hypothetical protein [Caulobacter hibisci]|uniref:Tryptophan-rich sensory protein n=1 Tax=Caulobacter hibisci TaxID=2035993 RepID=A0ABS0SX46_9CAUL|nr:hypothetical protein [Caulobacter hibisci]MBI1684200.1 hypothetical protein [Caulobacter hibisci]